MGTKIIIVTAIVVLGLGVYAGRMVYQDKLKHRPAQEALDACEWFVRQQIKVPTTAKFSDVSSVKLKTDPGVYLSFGNYDAQNPMGTFMRGNFSCFLVKRGDGFWHPRFGLFGVSLYEGSQTGKVLGVRDDE